MRSSTHVKRRKPRPPHRVAYQRSFIKWPGGKLRALDQVLPAIEAAGPIRRWVEPFLGGGAVFLNVEADAYLIADANADLINLYRLLATQSEALIDLCRHLFTRGNNSKAAFRRLREKFNASPYDLERAALFVYLNRHCFNGVWKYNRTGGFSVGFGAYDAPRFPEPEMRAVAAKLQKAQLHQADFREILKACRPGDVVYADPPYLPVTKCGDFTRYTPAGFSPQDHEDLAARARQLSACGVTVIISNHDSAEARQLYNGATFRRFEVRRSVGAAAATRRMVHELIAIFPANQVAPAAARRSRSQVRPSMPRALRGRLSSLPKAVAAR